MWRQLGVSSWPTLALVSPNGRLIALLSGEGHREVRFSFFCSYFLMRGYSRVHLFDDPCYLRNDSGLCGFVDGLQDLDDLVEAALEFYGEKKLLDPRPLIPSLEKDKDSRLVASPLKFPGKLTTDLVNGRLFISDSNHHRIVWQQFTLLRALVTCVFSITSFQYSLKLNAGTQIHD